MPAPGSGGLSGLRGCQSTLVRYSDTNMFTVDCVQIREAIRICRGAVERPVRGCVMPRDMSARRRVAEGGSARRGSVGRASGGGLGSHVSGRLGGHRGDRFGGYRSDRTAAPRARRRLADSRSAPRCPACLGAASGESRAAPLRFPGRAEAGADDSAGEGLCAAGDHLARPAPASRGRFSARCFAHFPARCLACFPVRFPARFPGGVPWRDRACRDALCRALRGRRGRAGRVGRREAGAAPGGAAGRGGRAPGRRAGRGGRAVVGRCPTGRGRGRRRAGGTRACRH